MGFPDIIYYINLAHRKDRNEHFLQEMEKVHIPGAVLERQEAIYTPEDGALGCALSHIAVIKSFLESTHETALICEDDFEWIANQEEVNSFFSNLQPISFDVCLLAGNIRDSKSTSYSFLEKAIFISTTSAYILTKQYAEVLLKNFKESYGGRKNAKLEMKGSFAIDCHWTKLQKEDTWYIANPKLVKQMADYSDIEKKIVNYGC